MKKFILVALVSIFVAGCSVFQMAQSQKEELQNFSVNGKTVLYKGEPIAVLQKITYSRDGEDVVKEMNFTFVGDKSQNKMATMINYLSNRHQDSEIEIEIDIQTEQITL